MIGGIITTSLLVGSVTGVLAPSPFQSSVRVCLVVLICVLRAFHNAVAKCNSDRGCHSRSEIRMELYRFKLTQTAEAPFPCLASVFGGIFLINRIMDSLPSGARVA